MVIFGLMILAVFWNLNDDTMNGSMGKIGCIFFFCVNQTMLNLMGTVLVFTEERPIFLREQSNKLYGVTPYYMSKVAIEMPAVIVTPMILLAITYVGVGFNSTAAGFFQFYVVLLCVNLAATSFGYFLSSIFGKSEIAIAVSPIVMMPLILFGGLFSNVDSTMDWISWVQY